MSLISDALKTAQRQRTRATTASSLPPFDGFFPHAEAAAPRISPRIFVALGVALGLAAISGATYLRIHRSLPPSPPTARLSALPERIAPTTVVATPRAPAQKTTTTPAMPAQPSATAGHTLATPAVDRTVSSAVVRHRAAVTPTDTARSGTESVAFVPAVDSTPKTVTSRRPLDPPRSAVAPASDGVQVTVEGTARPVDALMAQALTAQRQGELERSKQLYDRAIKVGPASAALYNNYGALLTAMGNPTDAVAMLRLALTYDQSYANAWVNLGNAQDALGDHAAAVAAFNQALRLDPTNRDSKVNLAWQYVAIGSPREARQLLESVTQSDPKYPTAHYVLAQALESEKDIPGAIREFTRFLDLGGSPGNPGLDAKVRAHVSALRGIR
jgi:Tfp pilus assembly protein PilF